MMFAFCFALSFVLLRLLPSPHSHMCLLCSSRLQMLVHIGEKTYWSRVHCCKDPPAPPAAAAALLSFSLTLALGLAFCPKPAAFTHRQMSLSPSVCLCLCLFLRVCVRVLHCACLCSNVSVSTPSGYSAASMSLPLSTLRSLCSKGIGMDVEMIITVGGRSSGAIGHAEGDSPSSIVMLKAREILLLLLPLLISSSFLAASVACKGTWMEQTHLHSMMEMPRDFLRSPSFSS